MLITMEDSYVTFDNEKVRILAIDAPGDFPVVGLTESNEIHRYTASGHWLSSRKFHARNLKLAPVISIIRSAPKDRTEFLFSHADGKLLEVDIKESVQYRNVYDTHVGSFAYSTIEKCDANKLACRSRIGAIKITKTVEIICDRG